MLGIAVPGQEALKPDHVRRCRRPDQDNARGPLEESHPPKDERAHDAFAEIGFGDQERPQSVGGINKVSTSPSAVASTSAARLESWPTSARNWPTPSSTTGATWPKPIALGDRDKALEHDEHAGRDFPGFVQLLPVRIFA